MVAGCGDALSGDMCQGDRLVIRIGTRYVRPTTVGRYKVCTKIIRSTSKTGGRTAGMVMVKDKGRVTSPPT